MAFRATYRWEFWSLNAALDGYLNSCKVIQKFSTKTDKGNDKKKQEKQQNKAKIKKNCDAALMRKRKTKIWSPTLIYDKYGAVARKKFQHRHYIKRRARIEFYKFLELHHAGSKIVEWLFRGSQNVECVSMNSFTFFVVLVVAACY